MRYFRNVLLEKRTFEYVYGCSAHCIKNFCMDIAKQINSSGQLQAYLEKTIKNTGLIRKLYDDLCEERLH